MTTINQVRRPTRRLLSVLVLMILGGLPGLAYAQAPPLPPPSPPEREGSAEFAFVGTTGNSSTQTIGLGGEYIYRPSPWETKLKLSYVRNEAEDQLKAQSLLFALRAQRLIKPRLAGYGQYGYQRDRFAGILNRHTIEGGLLYSLAQGDPQKLTVDAGFGYANEQRLLGDNLSTATVGGGGIYTLKISATSDISEDAHVVCSLSEGRDWRFANAVALTAKVTTIFSLKVSNTIRYVNQPVVGFKNTDAITAIALVAKF
jgi:putative salt-induced outer membrane protein